MCLRKSWATPVESKEVTVGMVWICLDRQSTTTRVALYPLESRSSPIMSMEITCQCQSGTLLGISFPTFCVGKVFVQLHALYPAMMSCSIITRPRGTEKYAYPPDNGS